METKKQSKKVKAEEVTKEVPTTKQSVVIDGNQVTVDATKTYSNGKTGAEIISENKKVKSKKASKKESKKEAKKQEIVAPEVTILDFQELVKELPVEVKTDKYGFTSVRTDKTLLTYLGNNKKGISYYQRKDGSWKVDSVITTKAQLQALIEQLKTKIARQSEFQQALMPIYRFNDFETQDRNQMIAYLEKL